MATKDLVNIITFTRTERDIHNFDIITGQGFNNAIIYSFLSLFFYNSYNESQRDVLFLKFI